MKIYYKDADVLFSKIIHSTRTDLKKLSQTDRKICLKAIECLSKQENNGIEVNLAHYSSFEKAIIHIQNTLESKIETKKIFLIHYVISTIKSILNFLNLRVSSATLRKTIFSAEQAFLDRNWELYLNNHCDIISTSNPENARVYFLGDQHADFTQDLIRRNIIIHYASEDQSDNLVLVEGLDTNKLPTRFANKNFSIESWETEEHSNKHGEVIEKTCKLLKESNIGLKKLEQLKDSKDLATKKGPIIDLITQLENIENQLANLKKEDEELKRLRDQDLIKKVRASSLKSYKKIFVIAGTNHLLNKDYQVVNFFTDLPCVIFNPKETKQGAENAEKVVRNIIELGTYDAAYERL